MNQIDNPFQRLAKLYARSIYAGFFYPIESLLQILILQWLVSF